MELLLGGVRTARSSPERNLDEGVQKGVVEVTSMASVNTVDVIMQPPDANAETVWKEKRIYGDASQNQRVIERFMLMLVWKV